MSRVAAILIGVPAPPLCAKQMSSALPSIAAMKAFLDRQHGADEPARHVLAHARRDDVLGAFADVRRKVADGDQVVVMFVGHGVGASDGHLYQAWALADGELTDADLARELGAFAPGVRHVVISDCCAGLGLFTIGLMSLRAPHRARAVQAPRLALADVPMVCIAGAKVDEEVSNSGEANLVALTLAAAARAESYRALLETFESNPAYQRSFSLRARPDERFDDIVLAHRPAIAPGVSPRG